MSRSDQSLDLHDPPQRSWRRYLLIVGGCFVLFFFGGLFALRAYRMKEADERYQAAVAETDRLDPHWRMGDLIAHREVVSEAEDSYPLLKATMTLLPHGERWDNPPIKPETVPPPPPTPDGLLALCGTAGVVEIDRPFVLLLDSWHDTSINPHTCALYKLLDNRPPEERLDAVALMRLRSEMSKADAAVQVARRLVDHPRGRLPFEPRRPYLSTLLNETQRLRTIANLLNHDALLAAQEGNYDQAVRSAWAGLNAARAVGDEPTLISNRVRIACGTIALESLARTLALGEPSPQLLAQLDALLADEASQPLLRHGLRGERAGMDELCEMIFSGEMGLDELEGSTSGRKTTAGPMHWFRQPQVRRGQARMLERLNEAIQAADLPPVERHRRFQELEASLPPRNMDMGDILMRLLMPSIGKVAAANQRYVAHLHCMRATLAAERYRREHGAWPATLDQLTPQYLDRVPADPFGTGPLRLKRLDKRLVIYTLGQNEKDDGGDLSKGEGIPLDIGYQLWDPKWRAQPASPRSWFPDEELLPGELQPGGPPGALPPEKEDKP